MGCQSDHYYMHSNVDLLLSSLQTASEVLANDKLMFKKRGGRLHINTYFVIPQLQWLGFDYDKRFNSTAIQEYIAYIVPK